MAYTLLADTDTGKSSEIFKEQYTINQETIYTHISHNNKL